MSRLSELYKEFDYYFDDLNGDVVISGYTFSPADILKECDPIAYNQEFNDYCNMMNIDEIDEETYA